MFRIVGRIMKKEFIQTFRDKRMLAIIMVAPVLQTIIFGFAVNLDLTAQPVVVCDRDRSPESRRVIQALAETDGFTVVAQMDEDDQAEHAVLLGDATVALMIPRGFSKDMKRGGAELFIGVDGSDSNTATRTGQEAASIIGALNQKDLLLTLKQLAVRRGASTDAAFPELSIVSRTWFNPSMRSAVFFVPGVLGLVLMVITMLLTSLGLTREKEIGTLEQIMVTPIRPWQLIMGKILPFAILGLFDVLLIVAAAAAIFGIPSAGPVWALLLSASLFLMTSLGMGLFISTISATQQQAMMNAFFVMLPALMLSGFVYPIENMPQAIQYLTILNPLRYFVETTRGIMVKGAGIHDLWPTLSMLGGLGLLVLTSASLRFKKRSS